MIDIATRDKIVSSTKLYWDDHVQTEQFIDLASGKEIGHRIADYVDDQTTAYLKVNPDFTVRHEYSSSGELLTRSMGDLWIKSNDIYNPINIKSGITTDGNPNVVSLAKLIGRLFKHQIDSYYLLIVRTPLVDGSIRGTTPKVYLIDLFDYLDYINFDAGPGQTMLKERELYAVLDGNIVMPQLTLDEKVTKCMKIMEDGYIRLQHNRERQLAKYKTSLETFIVEPIDQKDLYFG